VCLDIVDLARGRRSRFICQLGRVRRRRIAETQNETVGMRLAWSLRGEARDFGGS